MRPRPNWSAMSPKAGALNLIRGLHAQAVQAQRHARQEAASAIVATAIAKALGIGRASVYRALEADAEVASSSADTITVQ
jgi:hypothetical protein